MKIISAVLTVSMMTVALGVGSSTPAQSCDYQPIPTPSEQVRTYSTDLGIQIDIPRNYRIRHDWGYNRLGERQSRLEVVDPATFDYDQCLVERGELLGERTPPLLTVTEVRLNEPQGEFADVVAARYGWMMSDVTIQQLNGVPALITIYPNDYQQMNKAVFWRSPGGDRLIMLNGLIDDPHHAAALDHAIQSFEIAL
ncbi:MAG: hypothetical protein F6J87_28950 [Spirulina sp. SIO3F2]|nr:hypothetical protein [Spirulina sp. SIO3F2]